MRCVKSDPVERRPFPSLNDIFMTISIPRQRAKTEKVITVKLKHLVKAIGLLMTLYIGAEIGVDEFTYWVKGKYLDTHRPAMEKLADSGEVSAELWLVQHYWPEEAARRLPALVAKGHPEALYYQGRFKINGGDKEGGRKLVEAAAAKGYFPAIEYIESKKDGFAGLFAFLGK